METAALRGLSFRRGLEVEGCCCWVGGVEGVETDRDFWASRSGKEILATSDRSCSPCRPGTGVWFVCSEVGPAIEVSGILLLRGGSGKSGRLCGWYAGAV